MILCATGHNRSPGGGDHTKILETCAAGLAIDPDDAELLCREAVVRRDTGDVAGADRCWRRILTLSRPVTPSRSERFARVDSGIYGHLTRRNLATLAAERGDRADAEGLWREVLAECPGDPEALTRLAQLA